MFDFNTKGGKNKNKATEPKKSIEEEEIEQEADVKVVTEPEHVSVTTDENGKVSVETKPETKNLVVKSTPIIPPNGFSKGDKEEDIEQEDVPVVETKSGVKHDTDIKVPIAFDKWFTSVPHEGVSVRKAYQLVDELEEANTEVYVWVGENEDTFAKIWLGAEYKVRAIPIYETTIENEGKRPNILAKEGDGNIVMKPYRLLDDTDVTELTEEEIRQDWAFLFDNGYSRLLNEEDI